MSSHPYKVLPDAAFWSRSVAGVEMSAVDPVTKPVFSIDKHDRVATAGSCFAQHIARHLKNCGFNYFMTESPHPITPPDLLDAFSYGQFSARYGNIYTTRQLLQLLKRSYGEFQARDDVWKEADGSYVDAFRPRIQPGGFASREECLADREQHLRCVRTMVESLDVFVFTLGLTEGWYSKLDGAMYPVCPGVAGGEFDSARYGFLNLGVDAVRQDGLEFIDRLREVNPRSRIVLTVSPVPLVATAEDRHVLVSTTYSKSVLRVAAQEMADQRSGVAYFPSYEIITGGYSRGQYFASDLRTVTEEGVSHVMRLFLKHYGGVVKDEAPRAQLAPGATDSHTSRMADLVAVNCDEVVLDQRAL